MKYVLGNGEGKYLVNAPGLPFMRVIEDINEADIFSSENNALTYADDEFRPLVLEIKVKPVI